METNGHLIPSSWDRALEENPGMSSEQLGANLAFYLGALRPRGLETRHLGDILEMLRITKKAIQDELARRAESTDAP